MWNQEVVLKHWFSIQIRKMWPLHHQVLLVFACPAAAHRWHLINQCAYVCERILSSSFLSAPSETTNCSAVWNKGLCYRKGKKCGRKSKSRWQVVRVDLWLSPISMLLPFLFPCCFLSPQTKHHFLLFWSFLPSHFLDLFFSFSTKHCNDLTGKSRGLTDTRFLPHYEINKFL